MHQKHQKNNIIQIGGTMMDSIQGSRKEMQQQEFKILCEFDRICRKYKLTYFLTAGTLLGAIRHEGFIPWDDDIDVAMPLKDYKRFAQIAQRELSKEYFFQNWKTEKNYPFHFAKIRKNGTRDQDIFLQKLEIHHGIYIDLFPLETCPKNEWFAKLLFKTVAFTSYALLAKSDQTFVYRYRKKYERLLFAWMKRMPRTWILFLRESIISLFDVFCSKERLCTSSGRHGYPRESYQSEWFSETVFVLFEGKTFPAPKGWDALLTNMYGAYWILSPEKERKGHTK